MVSIKFKQAELIPRRYYSGELQIPLGFLTKICGNNGVGKSTIFHYCRKHKKDIFSTKTTFLNQKPLMTLNDYTLNDVHQLLSNYWNTFLISTWETVWTQMLQDFTLSPKDRVSYLSGGQNQLLKLMLASITQAEIFFFDEPFTSLDNSMSSWWMEWIHKQLQEKKTVVLIDHSDRLEDVIIKKNILEYQQLDVVHINNV